MDTTPVDRPGVTGPRDVCSLLDALGIPYQRYDHPAVWTCEQADRLDIPPGSAKTKNLFVRNRRGDRHILLTVGSHKSVDLRALEGVLDIKGLTFASPRRLMELLGLEPGSVTLLGVINDTRGAVEVVVDEELWHEEALQCHPLVNTSTLVISRDGIERFLAAVNHTPRIVDVPARNDPGSSTARVGVREAS